MRMLVGFPIFKKLSTYCSVFDMQDYLDRSVARLQRLCRLWASVACKLRYAGPVPWKRHAHIHPWICAKWRFLVEWKSRAVSASSRAAGVPNLIPRLNRGDCKYTELLCRPKRRGRPCECECSLASVSLLCPQPFSDGKTLGLPSLQDQTLLAS